jgi:hypothetical protein
VSEYRLIKIRPDAKKLLERYQVVLRQQEIRQIDFVSDIILSHIRHSDYENGTIIISY